MNNLNNKTILFLDDELELVSHYTDKLRYDGYTVIKTSTEKDLKSIFLSSDVDVAILDANLMPSSKIVELKYALRSAGAEPYVEEEGAGFRIAAWIRQHYPEAGVIVLSSERTDPADRVMGLNCGADDYAIKGMPADELSSRVSALLRRIRPIRNIVSIGAFTLLVDLALLRSKDGKEVSLTNSEVKVLLELASHPTRAIAREQLYEAVFSSEIPSRTDRAIDNLISKIRRKSLDGLGQELPVQTIYGGGYALRS